MSDVNIRTEPTLVSQEGYAYPYNRDGNITLPPFWDDAMFHCGGGVQGAEYVMRRMMRDPILFSTDRVFRALVCEGEHIIAGRVDEPSSKRGKEAQRYKRSEQARELIQSFSEGLHRPLRLIAWHLCEAFAYGNKLCEVEVSIAGGKVTPIDVSPKPRTAYEYVVDRSNRVKGARPGGSSTVSGETVPAANLLWLSVGGMDDDPNGTPALAAAYDSWYRKGHYLRDEVKSSGQSGGANLVAEEDWPPAGVVVSDTVKVKQADGTVKELPRSYVAATELAKIRTGTAAKLPMGIKARFLTAGQDNFGPKIDRCDREMVISFVGATRMTMEAQNGSRADSDTAEGVALSLRDWARGQISAAMERFFATFVELNLGPDYSDVVPRYDIVTEETGDLGAIGTFLAAMFDRLTMDQRNVLAAKVGLPEFPDEVDEIAKQDAVTAQAEDATFSYVDFKDQNEISNAAAQKRIDRTVRTADRQMRSLVKRLANGKLSEDEFRDRFAYVLSVGHDRAFRVGYKHGGGGDELSQDAETYIAEVQASEADFMDGLASALANGDISEAEANRRARLYANRLSGTANEAFRQATVGTDMTIDWVLGGVEEHCAECPTYASMSPWEPDELFTTPRSGDTPCLSNCRCKIARSDGRHGFGPTDFDS